MDKVSEVMWLSVAELKKWIPSEPEKFTAWLALLGLWWYRTLKSFARDKKRGIYDET